MIPALRRRRGERFAAAAGVWAAILALQGNVARAEWTSGPPAAPTAIRLLAAPTVRGPLVALGEIAQIDCNGAGAGCATLRAIELGRAPLPGQSRSITVGQVLVHLRQAGFATDAVRLSAPTTEITIRSQSQRLTEDRVERVVHDALLAAVPAPLRSATRVSFDAVPETWLPSGEVELHAEVGAVQAGAFLVPVRVLVAGRLVREVSVRGTVSVQVKLPVAARNLPPHTRVSPADVTWRLTSLHGALTAVVPALDNVRTTHYVAAGTLLGAADVEPEPAALAGSVVAVVVRVGAVQVSWPGVLLDDGRLGGAVRVKTTSNTVVHGTLLDATHVAVRA